MPSSLQAQITRRAISPRLAMRILRNIVELDEFVFAGDFVGAVVGRVGKAFDSASGLETFEKARCKRLQKLRYFFPSGRMAKSGWPYSTGVAFSTNERMTTPLTSDSISFINFMASTMQTT